MDLKQIEYIIAIDEQQSITRAADKLHITQSALNQQLLRLEEDL
ncbi:MAG: LysR family transcriptional regulator, partial [Synergistaceae bacterium]|nr:LysR family transcriptional regulator [Synergistaceae bacterium]